MQNNQGQNHYEQNGQNAYREDYITPVQNNAQYNQNAYQNMQQYENDGEDNASFDDTSAAYFEGQETYDFSYDNFLDENYKEEKRTREHLGAQEDEEQTQRIKVRQKNGLITVLFTLCVLFAVIFLLNISVLKIRNIEVIGIDSQYKANIVQEAGLKYGMGYLNVSKRNVAKNINDNRYLKFVDLKKHFPNGLSLTIQLRNPRVNMMVMGMTYVLDDEGMVLEKVNSVALDNGLMTVTGVKVKDIRLGSIFVPQKKEQFELSKAVVDELILQDYIHQIAELNVSNMDNIYLITIDGYTVDIGNGEDVRAKVGTVRAVVKKLREMGKQGGMIDACIPGEATYSPPNL